MTIDEAIGIEKREQIKCENDIGLYKRSVCRKHSKQKEEYHRQIAELLEELKRRREYDGDIIGSGALNNAYNQGYNKALNDFLKALHLQTKENEEIAKLFPPNEYDKITAFVNLDLEEIDTIAEQLKEGVTSGTDNQ